ncbi:MAG: STAS domain-containing protein [Planctomycetes bacterium]|nr:STAS domain-containing protein [Planctomycetota bacterium]
MAVVAAEDGTLVTLYVDGAIDSHAGGALQAIADAALAAGSTRVLVNLQKAKQPNSAGLQAMVQLARAVIGKGARIALVGPTPHLLDVLKATRLDRRFAVFDSTEMALKNLRLET